MLQIGDIEEWRDELNKKFCSSCGEMLNNSGEFCTSCGESLMMTNESKTQTSVPNNVQSEVQNSPEINGTGRSILDKINKNKWIYIAIAVVIAIFAYTNLTKSTPEKVSQEFVEAMFTFEAEKAQSLLSYSADEDLVDEIEWLLENMREYPNDAKDELKEMKKEGFTLKELVIRDESIMKDHATLSVDMVLENGERNPGHIELVKESNKWKIVYVE